MLPHILVSWELRFPSAFLIGSRVVHAVGVKFRQDEISALVADKDDNRIERCHAWLVREPLNEHDPKAVAVYIGQTHVGYLPANLAAAIASDLEQLTLLAGGSPPSALASVFRSEKTWVSKETKRRTRSNTLLVTVIGPWSKRRSSDEDEFDDDDFDDAPDDDV